MKNIHVTGSAGSLGYLLKNNKQINKFDKTHVNHDNKIHYF